MKNIFFLLFFLSPLFSNAQITYPDGGDLSHFTFTFSNGDTVINYQSGSPGDDSIIIVGDTSSVPLWQVGHSIKPVFSNDTIPVYGIMTDTLLPYPPNANDFFILKIGDYSNTIIDIWHKYETDSLHAGGIVEFSVDSGATWMNIANCSSIDTQNFYTLADTIISGQAAFTGTSHGEQLSRFQFLNCFALRETATDCTIVDYMGQVYVRFRFVSDSTIDSLSGWMIDSIEVEYPGCGSGVKNIAQEKNIDIFPNPATSELNISGTDNIASIIVTNLVGQIVYSHQYYYPQQVQVDVANLPAGIYFAKWQGEDGSVVTRKFIKN